MTDMQYRTLGTSNLKVSRLWLGGMSFGDPALRSWVVDEPASRRIIERAIDHGINTIDTCDAYCRGISEEIIGTLVKERGIRDRLVLATKLGLPFGPDAGPNGSGYSRKHIIAACEQSLRRLKTDYIDLYQTHIWQPLTNIEEMVAAFDQLVRDGKVLYVGATDMPAWQLAKSVYTARHHRHAAFVSMQHHYNPIWREDERELMPFCRAEGLGLVPYSPLARGFLCGGPMTKRRQTDEMIARWYPRDADAAVAAAVLDHARKLGCPPAAVALSWVLSTPGVTATVIGASTPEQLDELVTHVDAKFDRAEMATIDETYAYRPAKGHN
jgi:aryl-alcohol dehydrogenase-like predicted oxidoreductase